MLKEMTKYRQMVPNNVCTGTFLWSCMMKKKKKKKEKTFSKSMIKESSPNFSSNIKQI